MEKADYGRHFFCLAALFALGESVIGLPYSDSGKYSFLGFAAAITASFVFLGISFFLLRAQSALSFKPYSALLFSAAAVYSLYGAGASFKEFLVFVDRILLPDTPRFFIAVIFAVVTAYLTLRKSSVLLKLSVIFFIFSAAGIILFFLLSVKDFSVQWLHLNRFPGLKTVLKETAPMLIRVSMPFLLVPFAAEYFIRDNGKKYVFSGAAAGLALLAMCFADCIFLFGPQLSARCEFPLASAVSTVTVGPLFTRMDGLVYCLYFDSALIKTAFCLKICFFSLSKLKICFYPLKSG